MLRSVAVPLGMHAVATCCRRRALSRVISDPCRGSMGSVPRGPGSDARRTTPVAAVPGGWLEWRCSGLSAKDGIALTAERYPKYNTIGAEVDTSRPFQKLLNQRVIGTCHMTPTIHQSSAPIARPRLSELSRQVAVDFQPDADFDERRRCPGHRLLPFVGQYHSRSSAYRGGVRIQEIKIIAFVYDPGSRFHPDLSGRPTGIVLPRQHAAAHDDPAGARGESSSEFAPLAQPIHCRRHPPTEGTARRRVSSAGKAPFSLRLSNAGLPRGSPTERGHAPFPFRQGHPQLLACLPKALFRRGRSILSRRELTLHSIGVFNIGPASQACERTIL
jgi:hypothetical protein